MSDLLGNTSETRGENNVSRIFELEEDIFRLIGNNNSRPTFYWRKYVKLDVY